MAKHTISSFPIVGIGASAGGLAAFESFFSNMPTDQDPDMAFVLVQHLAPDHKSILADLIRRYTRMEVFEVEDGMRVAINSIYIIPPNHDMAFLNGTLQLMEPSAPRGQRLPIDFFFRSMAQDLHERAIGIILSGTGSDGTQGVRAIKGEGGMVIAQKPESAEYDGMPYSAIATGLVDYELFPAEMPECLIAYAMTSRATIKHPSKSENSLMKIFILLRAHTGYDFSHYKPNTIHRRIERRMALHHIVAIGEYAKYLQQTPDEVEALFHELLIGVTNFFRDPETFQSLKQTLPQLFKGKPSGATIRVWTTGCSTGEEAYSIAILLEEYIQEIKGSYCVQIFATDIDPQAIVKARAGVYPADIAADISPERLARFFTAETDSGTYRIHKSIRDMLVFSIHNLIKAPPFSKLDLLSCRNLLIYLDSDLQKKLIPLFHYALNPGGILYLGHSETIGDFGDLFTVLDNKSKLYLRKKENSHNTHKMAMARIFPSTTTLRLTQPHLFEKSISPVKLPLRELTEQALLQQITPAAVLVNAQGDILYLHGRSGMYLELPSGEVGTNNILKMAREGLNIGLTMALHKATVTQQIVHKTGLKVKSNDHVITVNLTIRSVEPSSIMTAESHLYLIIFEEVPLLDSKQTNGTIVEEPIPAYDADEYIASLTQELREKEEFLKTANEKLGISNEELRSFNEEMQSMNEELQSSNEELETSQEELQSVNEELSTVNSELQTKVTDLSRSNNDMNNLLAGTGIGTIFVDHNICILRFTPAVTQIINLILSDLGRPMGHIASNLVGYDRLKVDVQEVLDTLIPKEMEVKTTEGKWYIMRIQPYRTLENVIEGAVITFVEITETVKMREELREANRELRRLAVVVLNANDAITVEGLNGRILAWNPKAEKMYGWSESEALSMNVRDRIPQERQEEVMQMMDKLSHAEVLVPYRTQRITKEGKLMDVWITCTALVNEEGKIYAVATTEREIKSNNTEINEAENV